MKKKLITIFVINRKKSGYTYIELLIVVSILTVLFLVGTASYRGYQRRKLLERNVRMFVSDLRLAQEMALAGKPVTDTGCNSSSGYSLKAYVVQFYRSPTRYRISALCQNQSGTLRHCFINTLSCEKEFQSFTGISIFPTTLSNPMYITFPVLGRGAFGSSTVLANPTAVVPQIRFDLTNQSPPITRNINISLSGSINVN